MSVKLFNFNKEVEIMNWKFPAGETNVKIMGTVGPNMTIKCDFASNDDLFNILLLNNAIKYARPNVIIDLVIPYFPYARQDRIMNFGEAFALQVAVDMIKSCGFARVEVWDPHSDVLIGMFPPGMLKVLDQSELHYDALRGIGYLGKFALVSPDAGAVKKAFKTAKALNCDIVEATKHRDTLTGKIDSIRVDVNQTNNQYDSLIVVDDIVDGGATFLELGFEIRKTFYGKLYLCVTHGIFSKGIEVLNGIYDGVFIVNDMREKFVV